MFLDNPALRFISLWSRIVQPDLRRQFGYCQDLPGDMGITANHRRLALYRSWWPFGKPALLDPLWRLDLPPSENGTHLETRGPLQLIILGGRPTCRHYFSDRSHPHSPRRRARGQLVLLRRARRGLLLPFWRGASGYASKKKKARKEVPPASFPPSPPTFLPPIPETEPPTSCPSENPPIEMVQISSSPQAPVAPQEEAFVVGELAEITPSEGLPVQEVAPSPSVVQEEAVIEAEALPPAVEEEDTTPAVEVPAIEAAVEVIQEEVPTTEGALETIVAPEEAVMEVAPAAEEVSLVQATPPYRLLSRLHRTRRAGAWRDRIVPRMLSPGVVSDISLLADAGFAISRLQEMGHDVTRLRVYTQQLQTLQEIEPSAGEKVRRTSRDEAEGIARNTLAVVSSKLEEAKATLGEVVEELSEAKAEEGDARERFELAREQLQSAGTKVAYLTTQVEQIQESVQGLETGVVEAERLIAEVIATPTLSAAEEATLLSARAAFAELQQEMAKNL
ncbi:hypothetical protein H6P81_016191 [Aristolochia fimbriata]|uniref:Uncharacterized protein n=1 Tax=Aristolochia fimbriata TaxID=158543 RepID=A0AAV7EAI1_ARIFI|nr:hypothetical protein H6P81_016191 [Aristolochia fimbriata]